MKVLLTLSLVASCVAAVQIPKGTDLTVDFPYATFAALHRPELTIGSAEWKVREALFNAELRSVVAHNSKAGVSYTRGVNKFSDMTKSESRAFRGYRMRATDPNEGLDTFSGETHFDQSTVNIDWRSKNVLTGIKNQMYCGDCWAFSATESIESAAALAGSVPPQELSVGQITDCVVDDGCGGFGGCKGSTPRYGYNYVKNGAGLSSAATYPFQDGAGHARSCPARPWTKPVVAHVSGYTAATTNGREAVLQLLAKGPLSIIVYAAQWSSYEGGVFSGCNSDSELPLDHAVQLVGAQTQRDGSIIWIVRNSWGPSWGESGFIRLADTLDCKYTGYGASNNTSVLDGGADMSSCPIPNSDFKVCGPCGLLFDVTIPQATYA